MSDIEAGGSDLRELLRHMSPELMPGEFVFLCFPSSTYGNHAELQPIGMFMEQEGLTLIVPRALADGHQHNYSSVFSCITLQVQSSLEAVGLTAAFAIQAESIDEIYDLSDPADADNVAGSLNDTAQKRTRRAASRKARRREAV